MRNRVATWAVIALLGAAGAGLHAQRGGTAGGQRGGGAGAGSQGRGATPPSAPQKPQQPAQQQSQQPLFRSSLELVQVDVVVVGPDGTAIRGLTQQDFVVRDRGKPQTVSSFQEVSHEHAADAEPAASPFPPTLKIDVSTNQSARADRLVVMVVDDLHIFQGRTARAKELARQIILQLGAQASMAVLFTSGDHNTQVTEDRSELLAAADTLKGRSSFRRPHPAIDAQMPPGGNPEQGALARIDQLSKSNQDSLQDFQDNMAQYKTLQNAAVMLGADGARRKAFVMLSEGIAKDLHGLFGAMNPAADPSTGGAGYAAGDLAATMVVPANKYHDFAMVDMMAAMQRSSVATYIIDPRGEVKSQDLALENFPDTSSGLGDATNGFRWNDPVRQAQEGLGLMAAASGGFAVTDTNDFTSGLQQIIEDLDHYYLIGFSPADPNGTGYRRLDVRIPEHPDWTLRFRRGYVPGPPPAPKNDDPLVALSAGVMPKSDVPLRLWATAFPLHEGAAGPANAGVAMALEVTSPTDALKEPDGKLRDDVTYEVLAVDNKKSKVMARDRETARFAMSGTASGPAPDTVTYQIPLSIELAPGQYQLRVSATSVKVGAGGSVYLTIDVPDFSKDALALSGIAVGYVDGAHVPVGHTAAPPAASADTPPVTDAAPPVTAGRATGSGRGASAGPAGQGRAAGPGRATAAPSTTPAPKAPTVALPFEPSLDREFAAKDTLRVYAEIARGTPTAAVAAVVDIVNASDKVVSTSALAAAATTQGQIDLEVPLTGLTAGAYRVRITATDDKKHSAVREIGILIK
jgi:VWFA-related protein